MGPLKIGTLTKSVHENTIFCGEAAFGHMVKAFNEAPKKTIADGFSFNEIKFIKNECLQPWQMLTTDPELAEILRAIDKKFGGE